ncbi:hypothetical protein FIM08_03530 [SAR202 cluster bacterium AC-647-N09_OGT_505m]|nr:hypothetical protein [SAR202 cluster bacterium AC-647-N09_OGT_505m]
MNSPISVTSHVSRDFLQNAAYFNTVPKVVWEYVSNSVDNPKDGKPSNVEVKITKDRIIVSDDGSGMSREDLRNFFRMHAQNIRRGQGKSVRGRYGTGKCAAFGIADVLRVESSRDRALNIVELSRDSIVNSSSGEPFAVKDVVVDKPTTQADGTKIVISKLNVKSLGVPTTIAFVERHLGRQLGRNAVAINNHLCEYLEPVSSWQQEFRPDSALAKVIGEISLVVKVSATPLEKERSGIDILSKGIWHDTSHGSLDGDSARRIFGEVDMPALEDRYDAERIPPFDNTRNMTLNISNPLVVSLLGWIKECLQIVDTEISRQEIERKSSDESKRLERQAQLLERVLNQDFRNLQLELERIRRLARSRGGETNEDIVPGEGDAQSQFVMGGPEHGDGNAGTSEGTGEEERPGSSLLPGDDLGVSGNTTERRQARGTFHVEYRHEQENSLRSHYDTESRTIVVNLDHPQVARAVRDGGGIEGKSFLEMTYEIAFVEYAIALGHEKLRRDEFYAGSDVLLDVRETINRISRATH